LFAGYRPLPAPGLVAFLRGEDRLAVVVTRLGGGAADGELVELPGGPWRELLSGRTLAGGPTPAGELTARFAHALLVRD
jgi:hypothetical protein